VSCRGQGICGCGAPPCVEKAWWFAWGGLWWLLAFELAEAARSRMVDDQIDSWREERASNP
jgi:hypothetical protein